MKKVLVSGATSMIGIALIEECLKHDIEVYAIVRPHSANYARLPDDDRIHVLFLELDKIETFDDLGIEADVFYHFAWITGKKARNDSFLQIRNIQYTLNAIELARRTKCHKFIGAGSQAEYGWKKELIDEDTPVTTETAYGICKLAAGKLAFLLCQQYNIAFVWGRIFSVYGSLDKAGTMVQYAIDSFISRKKAMFSSATQMWDYLFSEDAGKAFYLLGSSEKTYGIYNIASGQARVLKEYIYDIHNLISPDIELEFAPIDETDNNGFVCSIEKLKKDTGFEPSVMFDQGIQKILSERKELT